MRTPCSSKSNSYLTFLEMKPVSFLCHRICSLSLSSILSLSAWHATYTCVRGCFYEISRQQYTLFLLLLFIFFFLELFKGTEKFPCVEVIWRRHCLRPLPGFLYFSTSRSWKLNSLDCQKQWSALWSPTCTLPLFCISAKWFAIDFDRWKNAMQSFLFCFLQT